MSCDAIIARDRRRRCTKTRSERCEADAARAATPRCVHLYSDTVDPDLAEHSTRRPQSAGRAADHGRPDQRHAATRRCGATSASSCSAKTWPIAAAKSNLSEVKGKGGVFKVTAGLADANSAAQRCFNTPLAEAAIVGRAIGMATRGLKPVAEIQFFDYIWPAMMQIRDELATMRWRSNGAFSRARGDPRADRRLSERRRDLSQPVRRSRRSRTFPACAWCCRRMRWMPAGLLRTAIRCDDPVLFLEHKKLYREPYNRVAASRPGFHDSVRQGQGRESRAQSLTIVTYGALVQKSLQAAHAGGAAQSRRDASK